MMAPTKRPSNDTENQTPEKKKAKCALDKGTFLKNAENVTLNLPLGTDRILHPKKFSTGSVGWNWTGRVSLPVGDSHVSCQVGVNCTVVGSKEWEEGEEVAAADVEEVKADKKTTAAQNPASKPMTKTKFREESQAVAVKFHETQFDMKMKEFSTGSMGWYHQLRPSFVVNGEKVTCMCAITCTALNSKSWEDEPEDEEEEEEEEEGENGEALEEEKE